MDENKCARERRESFVKKWSLSLSLPLSLSLSVPLALTLSCVLIVRSFTSWYTLKRVYFTCYLLIAAAIEAYFLLLSVICRKLDRIVIFILPINILFVSSWPNAISIWCFYYLLRVNLPRKIITRSYLYHKLCGLL